MVFLDDLKYFKLYKKKFHIPINKKNRKHGSVILLLTPDYSSSASLMNNPMMINNKKFVSYYLERDIMYTIQQESGLLELAHYDYTQMINEQPSVFIETTDVTADEPIDEYSINDYYCKLGDRVIFFNEMCDEPIQLESKEYNRKYRNLLYNARIRNNKAIFNIYANVKNSNPWITKTFVKYERYKRLNLFVDLYYYNQAYLHNNNFTIRKSVDMYFEFIRRFINDKRIDAAGYDKKTVFIPVTSWQYAEGTKLFDYKVNLNPISVFYKKMKFELDEFKNLGDIDLVFLNNNGYFKVNPSKTTERDYTKFIRFIKALQNNEEIDDSDTPNNSQDGIAASIVDKIETNKGITIHSLTGEKISDNEQETLKAELVKKIQDASENAADEDEAIDKLEEDKDIKRILSDLEAQADESIKLSPTRVNRINQAQSDLMNKKLDGVSIRSMINDSNKPKELPETALPIKTINDEWKHLKAVNFEKEYDLNADIVRCLNSLSSLEKTYPISILDINVQDTSTSEDHVYTYTVKCEDYSGKRFTLKFDIPKFRDNRFMRLRGNEKIFSIELPLLPVSKTDADTVQIATMYNKIFVYTYYNSAGKSSVYSGKLIKALNKYDGKDLEIIIGDNSKICNKYELPIDYIDLCGIYSKIIIKGKRPVDNITIYFNQDELREIVKVDTSKGIPFGIIGDGTVLYYDGKTTETMVEHITSFLSSAKGFMDVYSSQTSPKKSTYSIASIFNTKIPVIVILAHDLGLTKAMELANIKYSISDKKDKNSLVDSIKFKDGYINYEESYNSTMLMNGLKDCGLEEVNISAINTKMTWIDALDNFGGRIKSDGLDNFKDLMYDPITVEVAKDYKLPETYHEALIYASNLLVDNKYVKHTDLSTNRLRTNEVVAAQFYRVMSSCYADYTMQRRHGRAAVMYIPQSAVIDLILAQNTTSDLSVFQPLLEVETKNTISTKGVTGMNAERAYGVDKRGYDDSMINIIAQATGFASTVGVNRQITINPNIVGGRGYLKQSGTEEMNTVNTLSVTEALSPFVVTSDDVFRNDMTFVQTAKHSTPIEYGTPLLVTTGADAALPYLSSNMFAHKAKQRGKVTEVTDEYLLVTYSDDTTEYVNLKEQTMKNSDGGFYITLQLKTDLKVGDAVRENEILAYDKKSFSTRVGSGQVSYNLGCLTKVAIMTTEDGFEDSGVCSEWLSEAMASDIVVMKDVSLPSATNVLFIAKVGQAVREGDPVLIFQNAYDEEDANLLLKNLNNEDGDVTEIGRHVIKSKVTGIISDIKIYRTVDKEELSESLNKIVTANENKINKLKRIASKANNDTQFDSTDKLPQTGKLKNLDGVLIEIYMKYHDKLSVGDKLSSNANKSVLMNIFDYDNSPYTDFRPNEKIDMCNSCSALDGRQITSIIKGGALNKLMIELGRSVADIMGVKWKDLHEIYYEEMGKR